MKRSSSNPHEWYREEELARFRSKNGGRRRSARANLRPIYFAAACIGIGVIYLVLVAAGVELPI